MILCAISTVFCFISCNKEQVSIEPTSTPKQLITKVIGQKNLVTSVYVETNDVNPLNAMDYFINDEIYYYDIVELFASNIHKKTNGSTVEPTLYLNDKLTPVLENGGAATYVAPLRSAKIKVLLTVLGDWQHIGLANMNATQQKQFANILAWAVYKYGLDGIGYDDEYADYRGALVPGSYGNIISYTRQLIGNDKYLTVFDWGNTNQISSSDAAKVNYIYHGTFGSYLTMAYSGVAGTTSAQWFPYSLNLGNYYNTTTVQTNAARAVSDRYAGIMNFNLRRSSDVDPLPVLQAIATGAGWGTVTRNGGDRPRDAGSVPSGYEITNSMAKAGLAAAGKPYFNI